ncbi:DEAD/DEAH box helicase [Sedimentitalea sp. JM2-8]|uniref:DEAD/DEAH box helicase n=1 Tax=Sedimentitalea xiamensis TaxID=3050037 RepID=A0ABT7FK63_9RHOB|nr:DEAD/DEAH box helicase [Sedimentitalea xiamensis]MDK3075164.1 DEAD/DEAH box helicase [Sedimentitalea xiamensis]
MSSTKFTLRPDQSKLIQDGDAATGNVILVAPTGFGKTVVMGALAERQTRPSVAIAHRHELVSQISKAIAQFGVHHNIIASKNTVNFCIQQHVRLFGRSFYNPRAPFTVAGVDTLNARADKLRQWANTIEMWMIDECHHVLTGNKWGKATEMFPRATGIGFTATPIRADRKSLARSQGGVFDSMVVGPNMRELIGRGSLCEYRIFCPSQSIDRANIKVGASGDFSGASLRQEAHKSQIVGDIVTHYKRIAPGKRGITFVVDVDQANETAAAFRDAGVPAECVSAKTPDSVRDAIFQKFVNGTLLQLVNVDLFGEGVDVPAVEVVSMGRPTESYGLYVQQFGRALRTIKGKTHGTIIDHVGNVVRHGLPDAPRNWSLLAEERGKRGQRDPNVMPVTTCTECFMAYEAVTPKCPFCGHRPEPESRGRPEFVDGDLIELDAETLAAMRGEIEAVDGPPPADGSDIVGASINKNHRLRQEAQEELRHSIAVWAGVQRDMGRPDSEIYRRFYHTFGTDIMSAQTLGRPAANKLKEQIDERI